MIVWSTTHGFKCIGTKASKNNQKSKVLCRHWKRSARHKQFTFRKCKVIAKAICLHLWQQSIELTSSGTKGIVDHRVHRVLAITYPCAWIMTHCEPAAVSKQWT